MPPTTPDILICNIGELAEIFTSGYFLGKTQLDINTLVTFHIHANRTESNLQPPLIESIHQTLAVERHYQSFTILELM